MDELHTGDYDGFAIATSDGDFTLLARRLRNANKFVICAGSGPMCEYLKNSGDKFINVESRDSIKLLHEYFIEAYDFLCPSEVRPVSLKNLTRTMKSLTPGLELWKYQATSWGELIERFPQTFCVQKVGTGTLITKRINEVENV
jgi:hypothetical protein